MRSLKDKNILVTGGAGFIGSHLCDALLRKGAGKVVCVDNFFLGKTENISEALQKDNFVLYRDDARSFGVLQAIMEKEAVEVVYNMATIPLNYSFFNPFDAYMVNVKIVNTLLELLKVGLYKSLVHISSSEAYGTAQYIPMDENHRTEPTTPYASGKAAADLMCHSFAKVFDMDIAIVRPFNNYGPRQNAQGPLAGIIPATARRISLGETPIIEGDGEQTRDFIYVSDTVRGLLLAYEKEAARKEIINLGSGKKISMNQLMKIICGYMGYSGEIKYKPERISDVRDLCACSKKAKALLSFMPEIDLEIGIMRTLDWYMKNNQ